MACEPDVDPMIIPPCDKSPCKLARRLLDIEREDFALALAAKDATIARLEGELQQHNDDLTTAYLVGVAKGRDVERPLTATARQDD